MNLTFKISTRGVVPACLFCVLTSVFAKTPQAEPLTLNSVPMQSKISDFWSWFLHYERRFSNDRDERDHFVSDVVDKIRKLSPNMTVEISPGETDTMAISADGIEADFPLVQELVAKAPKLRGWKIVAFRQPGALKGVILNFPVITLDPEKMWIYPMEKDGKFNLIVYFVDYTDSKRNLFINGSYILLDNAIGEYDVVKGIAALDFQKLPPKNERDGVFPFTDLPKIFAEYESKHSK